MVHQENGRFTDSSGNRIAWYGWQPKTDPVAVVQLSHGMCEYVERYQPLAEFLCRQGVAFYGHDHPGHGQSAAGWEELGYFRAKDGASLLIEDLRQMHLQLRKRFPELPIFLLGHSMGSFVARAYLSRYAEGLAGAVICGTSGGNPAAGLGKMLAERVVRVKGGHHRSRLLNQLAFGSYNKRFGNRTPYEWLTRDQEIVDQYAADPFCNYIFTAAGFRDLFSLLEQVSASDWAGGIPDDLPLLLIAGEEDPVGDYGKGVEQVAARLREAGVQDLTLQLYPQDRHEIFNELDRQTAYEELWQWIQQRL